MNELLVLCYHAISPTWSAELAVTPDAFKRQVTRFADDGWAFAGFSDAVRRRPAAKTVVITFDDAFLSVKTHAQPVLATIGAPATVFVPTDYINRGAPLAWAGLDHWQGSPDAAELTPMSWDDLGELTEAGWELGSHTHTHARLPDLDDQALAMELCESREQFVPRTGVAATSIAYPYGAVDGRVVAGAREAGYEAAAALEWPSSKSEALRYPRTGIYHADSWPRFRLKVGSWTRTSYGSKLLALRG